jgi:tRNA threonylcarbamoyl adenosine modification protein YeaZ
MTFPAPLLCLDTVTERMQLGLYVPDSANGSPWPFEYRQTQESHRYHSAILIPQLVDGLTQAGVNPKDLGGLAVNTGPGSFTGVRTGLVTARIMGQFLRCPLFGFNAFELLAPVDAGPGPFAIFLDALRGNAYHAILRWGDTGPDYRVVPSLVPLAETLTQSAAPLSATQTILASPSLIEPIQQALPDAIVASAAEGFSPYQMAALINRYPARFQVSWSELGPVYLQAPNITMRKPRPGRLS